MFRKPPIIVPVAGPARTEYVTREVHEHRAPTDESVRLLGEMEEAARQRIVDSIKLAGNVFNATMQVERFDYEGILRVRVVYKLNGHRRVVDFEADRDTNEKAMWNTVVEALANDLAILIARDAFVGFKRGMLNR